VSVRKLAIVTLLLVACSASARQKTIQTTLAATDVARAAFNTFDMSYQQSLLAKASDKTTLDKAIADYRAKQTKIVTAFAVTYRAIAAAAVVNDQPSLDGMIQAALILWKALQDVGVAP
jgi:hypothetical protein